MTQVIVATEASDFSQAIYVDGVRRWEGSTAYALDIATAACHGKPVSACNITLRCVNVDLPDIADGFPETLDDLLTMLSPVEDQVF